eukprot:g28793.t1
MTCKPGSASLPFFGVETAILDENGKELSGECSGRLVLKRPVPSMMRTVESALVAHAKVAEAAVVGFPHEVKGEGIWCCVTLNEGEAYDDSLKAELKKQVREVIGAFAAPDEIHWAPGLPKTRSGKIMRRVLRKYESEKVQSEVEIADVKDMLNAKRTEEERETRRRDRLESELIELRQNMEARDRVLRQVKAEIKQQEEVKAATEMQLNMQRQIIENKKQEEANWQRQIGDLKRQKQEGSDAKKRLLEENKDLDKELKEKHEDYKTKKALDVLKRRKALDDEARHEMNLAKAVLKTETENLIREARRPVLLVFFVNVLATCQIDMLKKQAESDSKTITDILRDRESLNRALIRCDDRTKDQTKKVKSHDEEAQQLERDVEDIKLDVTDAIKKAYKLDKTREKYGLECSLANSKYMSALEEGERIIEKTW